MRSMRCVSLFVALICTLLFVAEIDARGRGGKRGVRRAGPPQYAPSMPYGTYQTVPRIPIYTPPTKPGKEPPKKPALEESVVPANVVILQRGVTLDMSRKPSGFSFITIRPADGTTKIIFPNENVDPVTKEVIPWTMAEIGFMDYVRDMSRQPAIMEVEPRPGVEVIPFPPAKKIE